MFRCHICKTSVSEKDYERVVASHHDYLPPLVKIYGSEGAIVYDGLVDYYTLIRLSGPDEEFDAEGNVVICPACTSQCVQAYHQGYNPLNALAEHAQADVSPAREAELKETRRFKEEMLGKITDWIEEGKVPEDMTLKEFRFWLQLKYMD